MSPESRGLGRVSIGLQMVYVSLALLALSVVLGMFSILVVPMIALVVALQVLTPVASILEIVGKCFCLTVPEKARASRLIYASVVCTALSLVLQILIPIGNLSYLQPAGTILNLAGTVLFLVFLRRLAEFLGRADQVAGARNVLIGLALVVALYFVSLGGSAFRVSLVLVLNIPIFIGSIVVFIMYANLLVYLRRATSDHAVATSLG